jgi:SAM-dependent methyltransferase
VQKPADTRWRRDADAIYSRYAIFRQAAGGAEQHVFDQASGTSLRRSEAVLRRLGAAYPLAEIGRALDVGCGNGPTLRALADAAPNWELYGHDISDQNKADLRSIPGFRHLYVGDPARIPGEFNLITFFHSLEHIPEPVAALAALRSKLAGGGRLLVEVPNVRRNIYDLVVADHRSHFDPLTLAEAARRAGFCHVTVFDDWAFKELTLIASDVPLGMQPPQCQLAPLGHGELEGRVAWLDAVLQSAHAAVATAPGAYGLFGTAIAATWTFGPLAEHVSFFVDEDKTRIGQKHEGRPILAPAQVPEGATVFVPLVPEVASAVATRLRKHGVDARIPPAQDFDAT